MNQEEIFIIPGGFENCKTELNKGFRMYFIACEKDGKSGLNYVDNRDNKVKTLFDKNEHANIFYVNDNKDEAFFHSIFSDTDRFSLGFNIN